MTMEFVVQFYKQAKPILAIILLQFGSAGMTILCKFTLNQGMSQHVLIVYRYAIATLVLAPFAIILDRKIRPKLTFSLSAKIALLALLEPVIDQNLYYTGMKYTTATFTAALCNILPALAFLMAWICRLEKVSWRLHSQAKIVGTAVALGGAMLMTLVTGPLLKLPWTNGAGHREESLVAVSKQDSLKGALMIIAGCVCWSGFIILQAITLKSYPADLSLTLLICLMGTVQNSVVALVIEWGNPKAWAIGMNSMLFAALYGGIISTGFTYYMQGVIMKYKGPVFVTAFRPLTMVIVAVIASFMLHENLYAGRVIGAAIIVVGLYLVLWGKSKDQSLKESDNEEVLPTAMNVVPTNVSMTTANQELVAIDQLDGKRRSPQGCNPSPAMKSF